MSKKKKRSAGISQKDVWSEGFMVGPHFAAQAKDATGLVQRDTESSFIPEPGAPVREDYTGRDFDSLRGNDLSSGLAGRTDGRTWVDGLFELLHKTETGKVVVLLCLVILAVMLYQDNSRGVLDKLDGILTFLRKYIFICVLAVLTYLIDRWFRRKP